MVNYVYMMWWLPINKSNNILVSFYQQTRETQALIMSPTRELAQQIQKVNLIYKS